MIHQLLNLTRPLIFIDAETTGLNVQTDRIVELGLQVWTAEGMTKEWRSLVNPGIPIPAGVTKLHSITDEMVQACRMCEKHKDHPDHYDSADGPREHDFKPWPSFRQIALALARGLVGCDFAGKSVRFDVQMVKFEFARVGISWDYVGARIIDADRLEQIVDPRRLADLYRRYTGKEMDAHHALDDVRAVLEVILGQLTKHDVLPRDLDALHEAQWPGWLTVDGKFRMVDGVPTCCFGKHKWKAMRDVPKDYYQFLVRPRENFSAEVKKLAAEALQGRFPE